MPQTLKIDNYGELNLKEVTALDADSPATSTTLTVKNGEGYANGDIGILGNLGSETSEKSSISAATTTTLTVGATSFLHRRFEPFTSLFGDQIKVYRATNVDGTVPADTLFTTIGTATIDYPDTTTSYTDATGGSGYWYKFTYYNSNSLSETSLADSNAQRGGGYGHYTSIESIRGEAGFKNNTNISDVLIDSRRIDAEDEINANLYGIYTIPFGADGQPVPALIAECNRLIAAGLLLLTEYGGMTNGGKSVGQQKLDQGRALLMRIQTRNLILVDAAGSSLLEQPTVSSYPNATTDQTGTDQGVETVAGNHEDFGPAFSKAMRF